MGSRRRSCWLWRHALRLFRVLALGHGTAELDYGSRVQSSDGGRHASAAGVLACLLSSLIPPLEGQGSRAWDIGLSKESARACALAQAEMGGEPKGAGGESADADALDAFMSNVETELENDKVRDWTLLDEVPVFTRPLIGSPIYLPIA